MKKFFTLLVVCLTTATGLYAQSSAAIGIAGILTDSITGQPEPYATVRIMQDGNTTPVAVGLTDAAGKFKLTPPKAGKYQLVCSSIGKRAITVPVTLEKGVLQLGTLKMGADANVLGEVTVKALRPIVKSEVDKLTYSMEDDPEAQTSTTLEMLRKVPMVTVDGEDKIQIKGSSNFKIYVNGKPNQMMSSNPSEIFKSYPASVIKKIEVITNPGAKYDAEGTAGVLNIITKTETSVNGYTLTPQLNIDNRGIRGSLYGMTQIGKFTLSAYYGMGHFKQPESKSWSEREIFDEATNNLLRSDGTRKSRGNAQYGNLDGSYEFSKKDLLSFSAGIFGYSGPGNSDLDNVMHNKAGEDVYAYHQHYHNKFSNLGFNASSDYQHTFKENQTLTFSYRLNLSPGSSKATDIYSSMENVPFSLSDRYTDIQTHMNEHTGQLDFTTPLGKIHTISTGVKYIYRISKSDNEESSRLAGTENDFAYNDSASLRYRQRGDIAAGYAEYSLKLKSFSAKAGARYEYYHIHVTYPDGKRGDFKTDLGDLIPSISLGYNLTPSQMLRMSYNMRIQRPDIEALSPYVTRSTPETMSYGNPNLKSSKANNFDLGYNTFNTKFSLNATLTYSFSNNSLTSYSFIDDNNIQNTTSDNFLHSKALNLNIYMNWTVFKGTTFNLNSDGSYQDLKVKRTLDHNYGFQASCWGGVTQQLPLAVKASLWLGGNTRNIELQGKGSSFFFYSLNLSREFLKEKRLRLSLRAGNFIGRYHHFHSRTATDTFRSENDTRVDMLRLGFGISYRFGSLNASVKKAARSIENNDIQQSQSGSNTGEGNSAGRE